MKPSNPHTEASAQVTAAPGQIGPSSDARMVSGQGRASAHSALELISLVVAPTALITALAFYFGWTLTNARSRYFGVDPSALDFSTRDYVLRSTDALYVPLGAIVLVALAAVGIHEYASPLLLRPVRPVLRPVPWVIAAFGLLLLALGTASAFWSLPIDLYYLVPPLAPGLGAALLGYGLFLASGRLAPLAITLLASLVVLSAFWATAKYADALGRGRAEQLGRSLARQPSVVVYSTVALGLRPPVVVTRLDKTKSQYPFRYEGLRLLVRSAGKYFLVPYTWRHAPGNSRQNPGDKVAIVLPDTDDFRFEFTPGEP